MSLPQRVSEVDGENALSAVGGDLQAALARYVSGTLGEWRSLLADLEQRYEAARWKPEGERGRIAGMLEYARFAVRGFERLAAEGPPPQDHLTPADFSWHDVAAAWRHDEDAGRALWGRLMRTARDELREGRTGAQAVEHHNDRPMDRAEYLAVWLALAEGLQPRHGAERLLVDGMAQALVLQRHWLTRMVGTEARDTIRRGRGPHDGHEPPRLGEAEAVDRATAMQDRFQRQFLRLLKCYRDQRRLFGTLVVEGGQINIAGQQVVANGPARTSVPGNRKRRRSPRLPRTPKPRAAPG